MPSQEAMKTELLRMAEENQQAQAQPERRRRKIYRQNALRLALILAEHGWPDRKEVGEMAEGAAWSILRQSGDLPGLQALGLGFLREIARRREIPLVRIALLRDRIRILEGLPPTCATRLDLVAREETVGVPASSLQDAGVQHAGAEAFEDEMREPPEDPSGPLDPLDP